MVIADSRDVTRCPWPHKVAHTTEVSALDAQRQWKLGRGEPNRAYRCPCRAWHTGRYFGEENTATVIDAPAGTPAEDLTWERVHCEWCWQPVVRARLRGSDSPGLTFCRRGHGRQYHRWLRGLGRAVIASLCIVCGSEFGRAADGGVHLYCSTACAVRAQRRRRKMRKLEAAGRALIAQSRLPRQDPQVVMDAVTYMFNCRMFPWPEVEFHCVEWLSDGQISVMAAGMPALIFIGTGPMSALDWAARDAIWIVWDGYAGSTGLRQVAEWAHVQPPARLELTGEFIERSFLAIADSERHDPF